MTILSWLTFVLQTREVAAAIERRSNNSLFIAKNRTLACLHFQQTLLIKAWPPLCLGVRNQAPTEFGFTVTNYISRGSNPYFQWWCQWQNKWFVYQARKAIDTSHEGCGLMELLVHWNRKYLIQWTPMKMHTYSRGMEGDTGKTSQTNSKHCCPQSTHVL